MNPGSHDYWKQLLGKLPYCQTAQDTGKRDLLWDQIDVNGNGYLSLAEVDKGIREKVNLPIVFDLQAMIAKAFSFSKVNPYSSKQYGDDLLARADFKYLLAYLMQMYEYWMMFDYPGQVGEHTINYQQFVHLVPVIEEWGVQVGMTQDAFAQIDIDKKGTVNFDAFCKWAEVKNLTLQKQ